MMVATLYFEMFQVTQQYRRAWKLYHSPTRRSCTRNSFLRLTRSQMSPSVVHHGSDEKSDLIFHCTSSELVQFYKLPKAETMCCTHAQAGFLSFCRLFCARLFYCLLESNHTRRCYFSSLIIVIPFPTKYYVHFLVSMASMIKIQKIITISLHALVELFHFAAYTSTVVAPTAIVMFITLTT
jgi:hypothetical protein